VWTAAPLRAPEGTDPNTLWMWLIAVITAAQFILVIPMFLIMSGAVPDYIASIAALSQPGADVDDPTAIFDAVSTFMSQILAASVLISLGSIVVTVLSIVFAALDQRELERRGVPKPFHWAFMFFTLAGAGTLVYAIGRGIVTNRRTGGGMTAMWVVVGINIAGIILTTVWMVTFTLDLMNRLMAALS
jgi:hypothetical protein